MCGSSWVSIIMAILIPLLSLLLPIIANSQPLVPAMFIFGDSVVDAGNNNHIYTLIKSNFPPYGRDFVNHRPTGRFCNGKLAADFTGTFLIITYHIIIYIFLYISSMGLLIISVIYIYIYI